MGVTPGHRLGSKLAPLPEQPRIDRKLLGSAPAPGRQGFGASPGFADDFSLSAGLLLRGRSRFDFWRGHRSVLAYARPSRLLPTIVP